MSEGGERLKKLLIDASCIKNVILQDKNIDILLYLAKYNPKITIRDIAEKFGKESLKGLKELENCNLVKENEQRLSLTNEGIFQLEGLLSIAV